MLRWSGKLSLLLYARVFACLVVYHFAISSPYPSILLFARVATRYLVLLYICLCSVCLGFLHCPYCLLPSTMSSFYCSVHVFLLVVWLWCMGWMALHFCVIHHCWKCHCVSFCVYCFWEVSWFLKYCCAIIDVILTCLMFLCWCVQFWLPIYLYDQPFVVCISMFWYCAMGLQSPIFVVWLLWTQRYNRFFECTIVLNTYLLMSFKA